MKESLFQRDGVPSAQALITISQRNQELREELQTTRRELALIRARCKVIHTQLMRCRADMEHQGLALAIQEAERAARGDDWRASEVSDADSEEMAV